MSAFVAAEAYEGNSSVQMKFGVSLLQKICPQKGWKALDIGCGTGSLTEVLAKALGKEGSVVALDPDIARLKIARESHAADNIEYLEGFAERLPEGMYDLVYSNFVLHWIKDKKAVFEQISKVLKKDGMLGLCVSMEFDVGEVFFPESEKLISNEFKSYFLDQVYLLKMEELQEYASKYCFEIQHFDTEDATFTFDDANELIKFHMTHGLDNNFTKDHFNKKAIENFYKGNFVLVIPTAMIILQKL